MDAENDIPACPVNQGIFDNVLEALARHEHPFVLVGSLATGWMGCETPGGDYVCDIVVREPLLASIIAEITTFGTWVQVDTENDVPGLDDYSVDWKNVSCDADAILRRTDRGDDTLNARFLRLYSDETYQIDLAICRLIEVPDVYAWNAVLIEDEYHPARDRTDNWWYGPRTLNRLNGRRLSSPRLPRGKTHNNPLRVFIPSFPQYLGALAYHRNHYKESKRALASFASNSIASLFKYLYLDLWHQEHMLNVKLEAEVIAVLQWRWNRRRLELGVRPYSRKPKFVFHHRISQSTVVQVLEWDPNSWPEDMREEKFKYLRELPSPWTEPGQERRWEQYM